VTKEASAPFFEKKEAKKLLQIWARGGETRTDRRESFLVTFFQKSNFFLKAL